MLPSAKACYPLSLWGYSLYTPSQLVSSVLLGVQVQKMEQRNQLSDARSLLHVSRLHLTRSDFSAALECIDKMRVPDFQLSVKKALVDVSNKAVAQKRQDVIAVVSFLGRPLEQLQQNKLEFEELY